MLQDLVAKAGGLFAFLTFFHFVFDWLPQSNFMATSKSSDRVLRMVHCGLYTIMMSLPIKFGLGLQGWRCVVALLTLHVSHYLIDSYWPILWWAKSIRKFPVFKEVGPDKSIHFRTDRSAFWTLYSSPTGAILCITVDQLFHLTFLWVPVVLTLM
jgi:hypothetical protein